MAKLTNISGFPEWLPEQKLLENALIEKIKEVYESHGFVPIETPSVELMSTLASQGVVDKELYTLHRAGSEQDKEAELGLHFDLTVPFARYVAQHLNDLVFPFKRYQLQRVWRGERPQKGRFREFYQFDVDIVAREHLPVSCDAEVLTILDKAYTAINISPHLLKVNNRKLLHGIYAGYGLSEEARKKAITAIDKLDKISEEGVLGELSQIEGVSQETGQSILNACNLICPATEAISRLEALGIEGELFAAGIGEMKEILSLLPVTTLERMELNLSLARGLHYYTGIIVEVHMPEYPEYGSVGGGGRYEGLVSQFMKKEIPGVGVSIGLTRLMDLILSNNLLQDTAPPAAQVLVAVLNEEQRVTCNAHAETLRQAGVSTEVFFKSPKLGKQIDFAAKKNIPYVLFVDGESGALEIKDLLSGEQENVSDLESWAELLS